MRKFSVTLLTTTTAAAAATGAENSSSQVAAAAAAAAVQRKTIEKDVGAATAATYFAGKERKRPTDRPIPS